MIIQEKIENDIRLIKDMMEELDKTFDQGMRQYTILKIEVQKLQNLLLKIREKL
jgi:hypothetical protein